MKKKYIISGILGGSFFAASNLIIGLSVLPSIAIAATSFLASAMIFKEDYDLDDLGEQNKNTYRKLLIDSNKDLESLKKLKHNISDYSINDNIENIIKTAEKIIKVLHKKPDKISSATKFLNYYLPITIKILERFDEIDEQKLTSKSSRDFLERTRKLTVKIENAFENQLNNLYNDELIDTNAEIKVFESVLKSDGLLDDAIINKKDGDKDE